VVKEVKVSEFNFADINSANIIIDSNKAIGIDYFVVGYDSLKRIVEVSRHSKISLNYEVYIYRDTAFNVMFVRDYEFDYTHEERGVILKGFILNYSDKNYFIFDSQKTHGLFADAQNITSIMKLDKNLDVEEFADFSDGRLLYRSIILYEDEMKDGRLARKFNGEKIFIDKSEVKINNETNVSEIENLFQHYGKTRYIGIMTNLDACSDCLYFPFWIFEGNQSYDK
jgi:hypothetical protein